MATILHDVQGTHDERAIAIDTVGISGISHPVCIRERSGGSQNTAAQWSALVDLPHHRRGIHMSRLVEELNAFDDTVTPASFQGLLRRIVDSNQARRGRLEMTCKYFVRKKAPVTGTESLMDYCIGFIAEIDEHGEALTVEVRVPVMSLCPCSKKIARYGAHNQRSHVTLSAVLRTPVWVEELVELVESQASSDLYAALKREDEAYVTEHSYENPKFVEDMIRDVAALLNADDRISAYTLSVENFESIHNHSAFARMHRDFRPRRHVYDGP